MVTVTRMDAGRRLALGLRAVVHDVPVVVAISPGGARVGEVIAHEFEGPLDVMAVVRLEVPGRPRSTFGAVADGVTLILHERVKALGLPEAYVNRLVDFARGEVLQQARSWRGKAAPVDVSARTVVLADDGTGSAVSVAAAATALRQQGAGRVLYAAPTASAELCRALRSLCESRVLLREPDVPEATLVCDPTLAQTTTQEIATMVRRSRPDLVAMLCH